MSKMHHHEFISCYNFIVKLHTQWKTWQVMFTFTMIARGCDGKIAEFVECMCVVILFLVFRSSKQVNADTVKAGELKTSLETWKHNKTEPNYFPHQKCSSTSMCPCSTFDLLLFDSSAHNDLSTFYSIHSFLSISSNHCYGLSRLWNKIEHNSVFFF